MFSRIPNVRLKGCDILAGMKAHQTARIRFFGALAAALFSLWVISESAAGDIVEKTPLAGGWVYEVVITNAGSRSEGRLGRLVYREDSIGYPFDRVLVGDRLFAFRTKQQMWDDGGYMRQQTEQDLPPEAAASSVTSAELERGWYQAPLSARKQGTPEDWVYVERTSERTRPVQAYLDPERLGAFLSRFDLESRMPFAPAGRRPEPFSP